MARPELTPETVVSHLLDHSLLDVGSLVEHGLRVEEVPGRNRNFLITGGGAGRGYFVKQAPRGEIGLSNPLAVEAALYDWVARHPRAASLRVYLPCFRHFDPTRSILILDLVVGAVPYPEAEGRWSPNDVCLRGTAAALAECHQLALARDSPLARLLPQAAPWVLDIGRPAPQSLRELAPAQLRLIEAVQAQPAVLNRLDEIRSAWQATHLIHGDLKTSNLLVQADGGAPARVILLDWELAQLGDPAWDVGSALHAHLTDAVLSVALTEEGGAEAAAALATVIPAARPVHRDFWRDYLRHTRLAIGEADAMVDRLPGHVAARLIKTAYEWCQAEAQIPRRAAAILQLGINMLVRPDAARTIVLGLDDRACAAS